MENARSLKYQAKVKKFNFYHNKLSLYINIFLPFFFWNRLDYKISLIINFLAIIKFKINLRLMGHTHWKNKKFRNQNWKQMKYSNLLIVQNNNTKDVFSLAQ